MIHGKLHLSLNQALVLGKVFHPTSGLRQRKWKAEELKGQKKKKEKKKEDKHEESNVLFVVLSVHTGKEQKNEKDRKKKKTKL